MKLIILVLLAICSMYSQKDVHRSILKKYIEANNIGTEEAFTQFIKETYNPTILEKLNFNNHTEFYDQIRNEFGELDSKIFKIIEDKPLRFIVHLLKKDANILIASTKPEEILVVKIDLSEDDPQFMSHSLGLGSLVCEQKNSGSN